MKNSEKTQDDINILTFKVNFQNTIESKKILNNNELRKLLYSLFKRNYKSINHINTFENKYLQVIFSIQKYLNRKIFKNLESVKIYNKHLFENKNIVLTKENFDTTNLLTTSLKFQERNNLKYENTVAHEYDIFIKFSKLLYNEKLIQNQYKYYNLKVLISLVNEINNLLTRKIFSFKNEYEKHSFLNVFSLKLSKEFSLFLYENNLYTSERTMNKNKKIKELFYNDRIKRLKENNIKNKKFFFNSTEIQQEILNNINVKVKDFDFYEIYYLE